MNPKDALLKFTHIEGRPRLVYYIIKMQVKVAHDVFCSSSRVRNSHINERKLEKKKKNLNHLFYIKCSARFRFNSLQLIWV
jgi:hypothetical protein